MRVLILNPPGPVLKGGTRWSSEIKERGLGYAPFPFFQGYALSVLREAGHEVGFIDCVTEGKSREDLYNLVSEFRPDLIAIETTITSYKYDLETVGTIDIPFVVIGMHGTTRTKECLKDYDYVCVGEYEYSLLGLAAHLEGKGKLPEGVASKERPSPKRRQLIEDLDALPWPARDIMPIPKYNEPVARGFNVVLVSSRGCPWRCGFCQVLTFYGKPNFRTRSPENVVDEMEFLWDKYKPDELYLDDDSFTASPQHVKAICDEILNRGLDISWGCMGLINVKNELLKLMAKAGCRLFKFGVEAVDLQVVSNIPKPVTREETIRVVKACREYGIRSHPTFMVGLLHSSKKKDLELIDFALSLKPNTLQFSIATPFPGTRFYDKAIKNGWIATDESKFGGTSASVSYPDYSRREIEEMFGLAWKKWNRHILLHQPGTLYHHLYGVWCREGLGRMLEVIGMGIKNVLFG